MIEENPEHIVHPVQISLAVPPANPVPPYVAYDPEQKKVAPKSEPAAEEDS